MDCVCVVSEFEHRDGTYRISYASQEYPERTTGAPPHIAVSVHLRPSGGSDFILLENSNLHAPVQGEQPVLAGRQLNPWLPRLTATAAELKRFHDSVFAAYCERINTELGKETPAQQGEDSGAAALVFLLIAKLFLFGLLRCMES